MEPLRCRDRHAADRGVAGPHHRRPDDLRDGVAGRSAADDGGRRGRRADRGDRRKKLLLPVLLGKTDKGRTEIYAAHSGVLDTGPRANIAPMRAIRTNQYKLIVNFRPDITYVNAISVGGGKEKSFWQSWLRAAETDPRAKAVVEHFHHRVPVELYDIQKDPYELRNLATDPAHAKVLGDLRVRLDAWIRSQGEDPNNIPLPSWAARPGNYPYAQ